MIYTHTYVCNECRGKEIVGIEKYRKSGSICDDCKKKYTAIIKEAKKVSDVVHKVGGGKKARSALRKQMLSELHEEECYEL